MDEIKNFYPQLFRTDRVSPIYFGGVDEQMLNILSQHDSTSNIDDNNDNNDSNDSNDNADNYGVTSTNSGKQNDVVSIQTTSLVSAASTSVSTSSSQSAEPTEQQPSNTPQVSDKKTITSATLLESLKEIEKILAAVTDSPIGFNGLTRNDLYDKQKIDSYFTAENVFDIYTYAKNSGIAELKVRTSMFIAQNLESNKINTNDISPDDLSHFYTILIGIRTKNYDDNHPLATLLTHMNKTWFDKASSIDKDWVTTDCKTNDKKIEFPSAYLHIRNFFCGDASV